MRDIQKIYSKEKYIFNFLLIFLVFSAAVVEISVIDCRDRDLDEMVSLYSANGMSSINSDSLFYQKDLFLQSTISNVLEANIIRDSGNSIAYHLLLHFWLKLFGNGLIASRLLSLLFYLASIVMVYIVTNLFVKNHWACFIAAFSFAFHPLFFMYGVNSRTYACAIFFVLLDTYLFLLWRKQLRNAEVNKNWVDRNMFLYALTLSISILIHYYFIYLIFLHFIFVMVEIFTDFKRKYFQFSPFLLAILTLFFWLLVGGSEGMHRMALRSSDLLFFAKNNVTSDFLTKTTGESVLKYLTTTSQEWTFIRYYYYYLNFGIEMRYVVLVFSAPLFFVGFFLFGKIKWRTDVVHYSKVFLLCSIFVSIILALIQAYSAGHTLAFLNRYLFVSLPFFMIALGVGAIAIWDFSATNLFRSMVSLIYLLFFLAVLSNFYFWKERYIKKENAFLKMNKQVSASLDFVKNIDDYTIIHNNDHEADCFNFHCDSKGIKQKISSSMVNQCEILLLNDLDSSRILLYKYPYDFTRIVPQ